MIESIQTVVGRASATRPVCGEDGQIRSIVNLTRAIEAAVGRRDVISAMLALATLRDVLARHFAREERAMEGLPSHDVSRHAHEHRALLSGLGAIHCAIVSENLPRLSDQVAAYVNRVARHVIEQDVPLSEDLAAA